VSRKYVALLRGINVGGKHKVPMKDLTRTVEDVGFRDVSTYIQSGNVLFSASPTLAKRAPRLIQAAIERQLGIDVPVVMAAVLLSVLPLVLLYFGLRRQFVQGLGGFAIR